MILAGIALYGRAVYVPDQTSRARSGVDLRPINEVKLGQPPVSDLPTLLVVPDESAWTLFRFGPTPDEPYSDTKFPVEAADEFSSRLCLTSIYPCQSPI